MVYTTLSPLLFAFLIQDAVAATITSTATTTPAPVVKRAVTTIGYVSVGKLAGTTQWDTITANDQNQVIATSGDLYKICNPTSVCEFFSCSNEYAVFATTSIYCGGASKTCSYWELATDINDQRPLTNYWCDDKTETGGVIYMTTPEDGASTRPSTRTSTNNAASVSFTRITSAPGSTQTSIDPVDVLPPSASTKTKKKKKSTPVGAIAGGVVGGIVLLGAIIFAVVFLLRRKKRNQANNNTNTAPQLQQQPQTQQHPPPAPVQYYQEQKPAPQQPVQQMPPPQQQHTHYDPNAPQAPQFYDPNAHASYATTPQQGGYAISPPEKTPAASNPVQINPYYADNGPVSPVPQYSPAASPPPLPANVNELPTGRM
ncbi:hypothetical protein PTMSG1_08140 [Pyrenophora teres f. maculata]|nr:hypothetical protein PTMSG1_08140 [Pyrenophora teres f. maculata]